VTPKAVLSDPGVQAALAVATRYVAVIPALAAEELQAIIDALSAGDLKRANDIAYAKMTPAQRGDFLLQDAAATEALAVLQFQRIEGAKDLALKLALALGSALLGLL
jgi:hypothetical protein